MRAPDRVLRWDVLALHLEEAGFLLGQRESALRAHGYTLAEVAAGPEEDRLLAHLEALEVAGEGAARRLLLPALEADEPELRTAAALALLGGEAAPQAAGGAFAAADGERRPSLARALQLSERPGAGQAALALLDDPDEGKVVSALEVLAFRRALPAGRAARLARDPRPLVRTAALRAGRVEPATVDRAVLEPALADGNPAVRSAALLTGLVSGRKAALRAARERVAEAGADGRLARLALATGGTAADLERLIALLGEAGLRREALVALGYSGSVVAADGCLRWLGDDELGGVAAEAFAAITGLELAGPLLREAPSEEGEELPPLEEDLANDLLPSDDAELPLAEPGAVATWWSEARKRLDPAARLLRGSPFQVGRLVTELERGSARRRAGLALELAIRSRGEVQLETGALTAVQLQQLAAARSAPSAGSWSARPFEAWMQ
ncbi:MAG: TIGR02270 family protein [Anaeromyxobacter sp.]